MKYVVAVKLTVKEYLDAKRVQKQFFNVFVGVFLGILNFFQFWSFIGKFLQFECSSDCIQAAQ